MGKKNKIIMKRIYIAAFWLVIWQIAAVLADNDIMLAGPLAVVKSLWQHSMAAGFWKTAGYSAGRICFGFLLAFTAGIAVGCLVYLHPLMKELLSPVISVMKAVPVAAFAVLLLIWFGSTGLTVWVSFLIVFPNVYAGTEAGLSSAELPLLEMAGIFEAERWKKWFFIYRPALMPYLISCCKSALGMSWKSGVAAEVIGMPEFSIGERLYLSKIYLDTAGVLAWTVVIIIMSLLMEKLFMGLLEWYADRTEPILAGKERADRAAEREAGMAVKMPAGNIAFEQADFGYGPDTGRLLMRQFSVSLQSGKRYCLMGASGCGKTTWLRLAAGLEKPLRGSVVSAPGSIVFQEDRLCMQADAVWNVRMGRGVDRETALSHLLCLLREEDCYRPVKELSGGMRRRVALCRAVAKKGEVLLMDEPFNGLDEENRRKSAEYIINNLKGRTLVAATHRREEAVLLGAEILRV